MGEISRIEQIHYELRAIARVKDAEEQLRILEEYRFELDAIGGGLHSSINGDVPGLLFHEWVRNTPEMSQVERDNYRKVRKEWTNYYIPARKKVARSLLYRQGFDGAKGAFCKWFDAPTDKAVSEIFAETFKVRTEANRIRWKGSRAEAIMFARIAGLTTKYLNAIFKADDGRKFLDSSLKPDRRKPGATKPRQLPDIAKVAGQFTDISGFASKYGYEIN